ncbi:hypothetical protein SDC9_123005 [bioreactor metagenome]|uniref:Uncharacterized protein n=1 Tax=bioreactor metagenome TaxID=1076179 RepID=A0A645CGC8_9ZZZZ
MDAAVDDFRVDAPAPQVVNSGPVIPVRLRKFKGLGRRFRLLYLLKGNGRGGASVAKQADGFHKIHIPYFNEVFKGVLAADAPAEPMPLAVADFQAVMGNGAVFVRPCAL